MGVQFMPRPAKKTPEAQIAALEKENQALKQQMDTLRKANETNTAVLDALLGVSEDE